MLSSRKSAIVLVEQHTDIALELTEDAIVLERGAIVWSGKSSALRTTAPRSTAWWDCASPRTREMGGTGLRTDPEARRDDMSSP